MNGPDIFCSEAIASERYRRSFRHDVGIVIFSSLVMLMFMYFDDLLLLFLDRPTGLPVFITSLICQTSVDDAYLILHDFCENELFQNILGISTQLSMLVISALIARKTLISRPKPLIPLGLTLPKRPIAFVGLTFGMCYSINIICTMFFGGFSPDIKALDASTGIFDFVSVVVIAPLFEEFLFRGIFFRSLARYDRKFAIIFTSVIFGLMHREPFSVINATVFGIFAAIACSETGSLLMGIMLHMTNNAISYFASVIMLSENGAFLLLIPLSLFSIAMVGSAAILWINSRIYGEKVISFSKAEAYATPRIFNSVKVKAILCTPWTWLFAILLAYSVFLLYI